MSSVCALVLLVKLGIIPLISLPVNCVLGRIIIKTFPPYCIVIKIMNNVGENSISLGCSERVGVGLFIGTGSNSEEAVLGIYCVKSAVLADTNPCDIIAYAPYLVALLLEKFRRNTPR